MIKLKFETTIGIIALTVLIATVAVYSADRKYEKLIVTVAALTILAELGIILGGRKAKSDDEQDHELKSNKLKVVCPECGRLLKGATQEMIGDTGICPKCKAEFVIDNTNK